jgi:mono/diheme cytochrome c family protein
MRRRVVVGLLVLCVGAGLYAAVGGSADPGKQSTKARIDPHVAAGAHDFVQFACAACHAVRGRGGVSPYVPALNVIGKGLTVKALVTYIRAGLPAIQYATAVPIPGNQGPVVAGAAAYIHYGCINCHGPNGLGGVPNPQSPDKTIPPLSGQDFRHEFNTDQKILDVIRSGSVIGKEPIASMPHWGGIIPAWQLKALAAYLKTLK